MIKQMTVSLSLVGVVLFGLRAFGGPATAPQNAPVEIGQWHSNFEAAKAKAIAEGIPLLVIVSKTQCGRCAALDRVLKGDDCKDYLATRGLIMVYHMATTTDAVAKWAGAGGRDTPMLRVTWFNGDENPPYRTDRHWISSKTFANVRDNIEAAVSGYVYDPNSGGGPGQTAPGKIEFVQNTITVNENAGSVTLQLRRTGGSYGVAAVQIGFADSTTAGAEYTATANEDFNATPSPTTLTWADGDTSTKTVTFALIKNVIEWEGAETFGVTLTPMMQNAAGPNAVVTINEVDPSDPVVLLEANYTGLVMGESPVSVIGTLALSVGRGGRISGKAIFPRNAPDYSGSFYIRNAQIQTIGTGMSTITGSLVQGRKVLPLELNMPMDGEVEGTIGSGDAVRHCLLYRVDLAERPALIASLSGTYTVALPVDVEAAFWPSAGAPMGSGYVTIRVDTRGRFRAAGKLPDGSSASQSGELFVVPDDDGQAVGGLPQAYAVLYAAPTAYQGGRMSGVIRFGDVNENGIWDVTAVEEFPITCESYKPTAVPVYDPDMPGFTVRLNAVGGKYNSSVSLHTVFQGQRLFVGELGEPAGLPYRRSTRARNEDTGRITTSRTQEIAPCASWQATVPLEIGLDASGTGFVVPRSDLALIETAEDGEPLYNYGAAVNPNGLRIMFSRTTGLVRGSSKAHYDYLTSSDATRDPVRMRWRHVSKSLSFKGVLLQEQAGDVAPTMAAGGQYLSSGMGTYPGSTRSYRYKQSTAFLLELEGN